MNHPILNRDRDKIGPNAVSIMRPHPLGNPYAIGPDGERDTVIEKYRAWLDARIQERDPVVCTALLGISPGQALACHCVPARCHGEVIVSALDSGRVGALRKWGCSLQGARSFRYAGIGSRDTPASILDLMTRIARRLSAREPWGYTLLSGGAAGADSAFERGAGSAKEVFLPWNGYNGGGSPDAGGRIQALPLSDAYRVAAELHPGWSRLSDAARALMARNSHQILGADLKNPVDFVICWTPDGCETEAKRSRRTGGTGQAIALASRWGIPVFNLRRGEKETLNRIKRWLDAEQAA
ncbi:DUF4326 domain-containing protein [Acidithiobacillus ferridurans]|nr:DUF4326 domain-containing protein [Acidithiobacillus ferridurans]MBU2714595.1 DUF4326 domain-containing protein [Acidithiobacillus ferridurans]MBU2726318.1 DUF4326 domain-containing protein [Acidithiobacillus ferridurans]